jgi:hypothetical protein
VSYETLAVTLEGIGKRLRQHAAHVEGAKLAAAAEKLESAATKFAALLDGALRGFDPDTVALRELLESASARESLDAKALKLIAKKSTGKALTLKAADTPQDARARLLDLAAKQAKAADVARAVRDYLDGIAAPGPEATNREAVLAEVWKLGKLSGPDLELAKERLVRNEALLRAMAAFTFVKTTPRSKPAAIFAALVKFAKRVNENVS